MERVNVLIAGGGIIGSAVAYALALRGVTDIQVVDLDLAGVYASSELNAGGVRATWWQAVNIETCRRSLDFFRTQRERFGFRENGYLWLYADRDLFDVACEKSKLQNNMGLGVELLSVAEAVSHCPLIDRGLEELVGATWSPRDGLINPNAVRSFYRSEAEALGVRFLNRHYVDGVVAERVAGETGLRRVRAVDASDLYFHPEAGYVMAGYSIPEEAPGFDFDYDGVEFFETFVWPRLAHRASIFERCGHVRGWSGLYAVTPDCSGIAGPVPGIPNLFEAHSFTGRGVMQSYGVALALAERIVDGRSSTTDLTVLGRQRFASRNRWLPETLHI